MQFYSVRLRGLKLLQIDSVPGSAKVSDIKQILNHQFGGRLSLILYYHGVQLIDETLISDVFDSTSPALDGSYYLLYSATTLRMAISSTSISRARISSKSRYLAARGR